MCYVLTGSCVPAFVNAHTNLTEIDESLKLLWRNNIDPSKVVLGLGFYGRSFTLQDPSCTAPGCPFSGGAPAGPCTDSVGTLSFAEIETLIETGATVTLDEAAAVKMVTWDDNWVSYDDAETFQTKIDFANRNCLGGTMVWAVSLDDSSGTASNALAAASGSGSGRTPRSVIALTQNPLSGCALSGCAAPGSPACPAGQSAVFSTTDGCGVTHAQIAQAGSDAGFPQRHYCCPSNQMATCSTQAPDPASHSCFTPSCPPATVNVLTTQRSTAQIDCPNVNVNYCCNAPNLLSPRSLGCFWTSCGTSTCPSDTAVLVSATAGQDGGSPSCLGGQQQTLCCPSPLAIDKSTCAWQHGSSLLGMCVAACPSGKISVADDIGQGGCILGFSSYCCDPPAPNAASVDQAVQAFQANAHAFMANGVCSAQPAPAPEKRQNSDGSSISSLQMAKILLPLLYAWNFDSFERPLIQPYQAAWDQERLLFPGGDFLSFQDLADQALPSDTSGNAATGVLSGLLCHTIDCTVNPTVFTFLIQLTEPNMVSSLRKRAPGDVFTIGGQEWTVDASGSFSHAIPIRVPQNAGDPRPLTPMDSTSAPELAQLLADLYAGGTQINRQIHGNPDNWSSEIDVEGDVGRFGRFRILVSRTFSGCWFNPVPSTQSIVTQMTPNNLRDGVSSLLLRTFPGQTPYYFTFSLSNPNSGLLWLVIISNRNGV